MKDKLLALAVVRKESVKIGTETVMIREVGTEEFARYGVLAKGEEASKDKPAVPANRVGATAYLISCCVIDDNDEPVFTEQEALPVAKIARVAMPIVNKVMELSGFGDKEEPEKHAVAG